MKKQILAESLIVLLITLNLSGCIKNDNPNRVQVTNYDKNILIETDKEVYLEYQEIVINIFNNNSEKLIFGGWSGCDGYSFSILKYENGLWVEFPSSCGLCEMLIKTAMEPFENITLIWNQKIFSNISEECETEYATTGFYKIKIKADIKNTNIDIFSNNFTIFERPKSYICNNVTINNEYINAKFINIPNDLYDILKTGNWIGTGSEGCIMCHACDICSCIEPNVWVIDNVVTISIIHVSCQGRSYIISYDGIDYLSSS